METRRKGKETEKISNGKGGNRRERNKREGKGGNG